MPYSTTTRKAFTLIELLTVIAIIAILAALIFPTFARVAEQRRQSQCMSQMHDIWRALKLYQLDNNKYPAALFGLAQNADGSYYTGSGQPLPADQLTYRPLMTGQKYLRDRGIFNCPDNGVNDAKTTAAVVYPAGVPLTGPVTFTQTVAHNLGQDALATQTPYFYVFDSYDVGPQVDKDGNPVTQGGSQIMELHYSLDWTGVVGHDDPQNQLKYPNPPDDRTVVTWCTYHVKTAHSNVIPVILLSGTVKAVPTDRFLTQGPLNFKF